MKSIIKLILLSVLFLGCAKKSENSPQSPTPPEQKVPIGPCTDPAEVKVSFDSGTSIAPVDVYTLNLAYTPNVFFETRTIPSTETQPVVLKLDRGDKYYISAFASGAHGTTYQPATIELDLKTCQDLAKKPANENLEILIKWAN